jgi:hypothetical protein
MHTAPAPPTQISGTSARDALAAAPDAVPLDRPRTALSARARRVARAAVEALLCDEDEDGALVPASPEACERAVAGLDDSLARSSGELRRAFGVLAIVLELLPLLVIGVPRRMSRLPLERRLAYLEALESSRIGWFSMLLVAFKVPLCIPAFEEGEELRSTGFDRESLSARRLPVARTGDREAA